MGRHTDESSSLIEKDEEDWTRHNCCPLKKHERFYDTYIRPLVAEFFGTLFLVYCGAMSVVSGDLLIIAITQGLSLAFVVIIFRSISGAHVNPAVTLGIALSGNIGMFQTFFYILAQLAGSIAGAAIVQGTLDGAMYDSILGGTPVLAPGVSVLRGTFMEAMMVFILVLVILLTCVDQHNMFSPIAIGLALTIAIITGGPVTGAAVNPARAFGPAVIWSTESTDHWAEHWIYEVGAILGALASAVLFRFILASPSKRTVCHDDFPDEEQTLVKK